MADESVQVTSPSVLASSGFHNTSQMGDNSGNLFSHSLEARSPWSPCSLLPASSSFQWLRIPLGLGHITSISASVFTRPSPPSIFPFSLSLLFWYLFIYLWLCWVFIAAPRLSLVAASGGYSASQCARVSPRGLLMERGLLTSVGSRRRVSVAVTHGLSSCGTRA